MSQGSLYPALHRLEAASLYRADAGIIGRQVVIDGEPATVVGVLPADFRFRVATPSSGDPSTSMRSWPAERTNGPGIYAVCPGLAIGVTVAAALGNALASLQYGVTVADPASWAIVLGLLTGTIAVASWRPAQEAMRPDPLVSLREH